MSTDPVKTNLNTILLACLIGVGGWNAKTTFDMSREVSSITSALSAGEKRDSTQERDLIELRARITQCEIEIAKLKK